MSLFLRFMLILGSIGTCYFVLRKIQKNTFIIEDSLYWIIYSVILVIMGLFPGIMTWLAAVIGIESPTNLVYLLIIFALLIKLFMVSIRVSQLESKINILTQEYAIEHKLNQQKEKVENSNISKAV